MVDAQGNRIVSFRWLIGSGISSVAVVVAIMTWILSMFFSDLKERFVHIENQLEARVRVGEFLVEKGRVDEIKAEIKRVAEMKLDTERYQADYLRFCSDLDKLNTGQDKLGTGQIEIIKMQQRVLQKLDIR